MARTWGKCKGNFRCKLAREAKLVTAAAAPAPDTGENHAPSWCKPKGRLCLLDLQPKLQRAVLQTSTRPAATLSTFCSAAGKSAAALKTTMWRCIQARYQLRGVWRRVTGGEGRLWLAKLLAVAFLPKKALGQQA